MEIRKAKLEDLDSILSIYDTARAFMKSYGNATQWGDAWPPKEVIISDIEEGNGYVVVGKDDLPHAVFALIFDKDPNYESIDGAWLNDEPYAVIHRIASDGSVKGILSMAVDYASHYIKNIRIDTHQDNSPMLRAIKKCGFVYCGGINLDKRDGDSARLAFALALK